MSEQLKMPPPEEFVRKRQMAIQQQLMILKEKVIKQMYEGRICLIVNRNEVGENEKFFSESIKLLVKELKISGFYSGQYTDFKDDIYIHWNAKTKTETEKTKTETEKTESDSARRNFREFARDLILFKSRKKT